MKRVSIPLRKTSKTKLWLGHIAHWQTIAVFMAVYDFVAICAAYFFALWLRFDGSFTAIPASYMSSYATFIFPAAAVSIKSGPRPTTGGRTCTCSTYGPIHPRWWGPSSAHPGT